MHIRNLPPDVISMISKYNINNIYTVRFRRYKKLEYIFTPIETAIEAAIILFKSLSDDYWHESQLILQLESLFLEKNFKKCINILNRFDIFIEEEKVIFKLDQNTKLQIYEDKS